MDITGLAAGDYTIRAELNPPINFQGNETRAFQESNYVNNVGRGTPTVRRAMCSGPHCFKTPSEILTSLYNVPILLQVVNVPVTITPTSGCEASPFQVSGYRVPAISSKLRPAGRRLCMQTPSLSVPCIRVPMHVCGCHSLMCDRWVACGISTYIMPLAG